MGKVPIHLPVLGAEEYSPGKLNLHYRLTFHYETEISGGLTLPM
jgi:hypothetical protein